MSAPDTKNSYGSISKVFHWLILLLLIIQFTLGYVMTSLGKAPLAHTLTWWHESTGVLIFVLAIVFLLWRLGSVTPSLAEMPVWQRVVGRGVHDGLYICLFLQPLLGMTEVMLSGKAISVYGIFTVPQLVSKAKHLSGVVGSIHNDVAIALLVLVGLHVLAALYHEFVVKDNILRRMLPGTSAARFPR
jgi:cytochrome b561